MRIFGVIPFITKINKQIKRIRLALHLIKKIYILKNKSLIVVKMSFCSLLKGITQKIPIKNKNKNTQRYSEPFMCLDLVCQCVAVNIRL